MQWKHYLTDCVSHQNIRNYSLSAFAYNKYIDKYDSGENPTLLPRIIFLFTILVDIEKRNIKAGVNPCHSKKTVLIVTVSVPQTPCI